MAIDFAIHVKYRSISRAIAETRGRIPLDRFRNPEFLKSAAEGHIQIRVIDALGRLRHLLHLQGAHFTVEEPPTYE